MAGPPRHWQGLTEPQLGACDALARARVEALLAGWPVDKKLDSGSLWLMTRLQARCEGAALAWFGGLAAGVVWRARELDQPRPGFVPLAAPSDQGHLWMGQVVIAVVGVLTHTACLWSDPVFQDRMYVLVSGQDCPNYAVLGWAKGYELTGQMRKDAREFRDARELRGLGLASIERCADIQAARRGRA